MVPEGWMIAKWGEIATLEYGKGLTDYKGNKGNIPVYGTNGLIGYTNDPLCKFPSVVVGRKGAYRGVHYSRGPFFVIDTAFYLNPRIKDLDLKFAYYQLLTQNINQMDSGSAIPSTSREDFYNLSLLLPDILSQKKIAAILSSLDDKIELNLRMNKTLEAIAQAIFKEWFVDFRFPGFDGKLTNGLPKGWRKGNYYDLAKIQTGKGLKREEYLSDGQYYVKGANGVIGKTNKYLYDDFLILTGRVGTLGQIYFSRGKCWISDNVLISKPIDYPYYTYFILKSINLLGLNRGSTQPLITQTDLKNQSIIIPENKLIESFEKLVSYIYDKIDINSRQNQTITLIRDILLPKLMTGKIRVA